MKKFLILILTLVCQNIFAQNIKSWQNFSSMNQINDIAIKDNILWAATNGGIFNFSFNDSSYQVLTKSEGLSSHTNTTIAIDLENKIWIGTSEGYINIYDPSTNSVETIYDIIKVNSSNKSINDIQIRNDTAFVSTSLGLSLLNTKNLSFYYSILKFGTFPTESTVHNIFLSDKIIVTTQAGIAENKINFSNLSAPTAWNNINISGVSSIKKTLVYNDELYSATNRGIYKLVNGIWSQIFLNNLDVDNLFVVNSKLYSIVHSYNSDQRLTKSSLYHNSFENGSILIKTVSRKQITDISLSPNSKLLVGSYNGLEYLENEDNNYLIPNSPRTNAFISLTVDNDGNLWSATGKNGRGVGVLKFDGKIWETISNNKDFELKSNDFYKVYASNNALYYSNWGQGFIQFKNDEYKIFNTENTNLLGTIKTNNFIVINEIREDINGNAWILNYESADRKPISVLTPEGEIYNYQFSSPLSPSVEGVEYLAIDEYNTKWFAGDYNGDQSTNGLYYFNENGTFDNLEDDIWGKLTTSNGLRSNNINALVIDEFGELIIGTTLGIDVIPNPSSPGSIRNDQYFSMRQQTITAIAIDPLNQKWFGTEKGVFLTTSDGSSLVANYTKSNSPLPSDNIRSIAIDSKSGIVYVGTEFGVTAISTLFIQPNDNFSDIFVYPNPIILENNSNINLIIDGLIKNSKIKVLDISGKLVNEFSSIGGKTTFWNCKNSDGKLIASGVYIIVAYDAETNKVGHAKVAVIRK